MSYKESDWKLIKKLIPIWQERYMTKLNKEAIKHSNIPTRISFPQGAVK